MPACGTVTTSPACKGMLFRMSPVSSSSLRLMVMMFPVGTVASDVLLEFAGGAGLCTISVAEGNTVGFELDVASLSLPRAGASCEEDSASGAVPGGDGEIGSGVGTGTKLEERARVMMIVSPASLVTPPASASTSSKRTLESAS